MICLLKSNDILKGYFIKRYDKNYQKDKQDMTSWLTYHLLALV